MARKKKVDVDVKPVEQVVAEEVKEEAASALFDEAPAEVGADAPADVPAESPADVPAEPPADVKVEEPSPKKADKKTDKKADKKKSGLAVGTKELFAARIYASSVATKPIALAQGTIYIVDTEVHDGRVRTALDENLTKIGWSDVSEIER